MKAELGALLVIVIGIGVLAASFAWPQVVGGKREWTDAQAEEFTAAARVFHGESLKPQGDSPLNTTGEPSPEFLRAQDKFLQMEQQLNEARTAGHGTARILLLTGVGLVILGGIAYFALRGDNG